MEDRRQIIVEQLEQEGTCSYEELAKHLRVSSMTIRRDVDELTRRGALIRTVGGVQKAHAPSYLYETALHSRISLQRREKQAIALRALDLVSSDLTLFLDGSTTCLELAKLLARERQRLTIVT